MDQIDIAQDEVFSPHSTTTDDPRVQGNQTLWIRWRDIVRSQNLSGQTILKRPTKMDDIQEQCLRNEVSTWGDVPRLYPDNQKAAEIHTLKIWGTSSSSKLPPPPKKKLENSIIIP